MTIEEDYEVGEDCYEQVTIESFGRRAVLSARQTLVTRVLEIEKNEILQKYKVFLYVSIKPVASRNP